MTWKKNYQIHQVITPSVAHELLQKRTIYAMQRSLGEYVFSMHGSATEAGGNFKLVMSLQLNRAEQSTGDSIGSREVHSSIWSLSQRDSCHRKAAQKMPWAAHMGTRVPGKRSWCQRLLRSFDNQRLSTKFCLIMQTQFDPEEKWIHEERAINMEINKCSMQS